MSRDVKYVTPDMRMVDLLELLRQARISGAPVVSDGALLGVISLEDLIRSMTAMDIEAPVVKYMTTKVIAVNSFDPVVEALEMFIKANVGRLPVVDETGQLVGMITRATSPGRAERSAKRLPGRGDPALPRQPPVRGYQLRTTLIIAISSNPGFIRGGTPRAISSEP
jgi:Mg/Co/Ni transporter MgtE